MPTKRKFVGRRNKTAKFSKQNKTKLRKTVKLTKSKRHNKKRKYNTKRRRQKGGDGDECAICGLDFEKDENGNIIDDIITLNCGHKFHRDELIQWCQTKGPGRCTCPNDRINISAEMAQYMPTSNDPNQNNNLVNPNNIGIVPPGSRGLHAERPTEILENFQNHTFELLSSMPFVPLPEAPYIVGADLPVSREGGPKERIKNLLICLFSDADFGMEIVDDDEAGVGRLKVELISKMMNLVNDNLNYTDIQLRRIITHFLTACVANALGISLINEPDREVAPPRRVR